MTKNLCIDYVSEFICHYIEIIIGELIVSQRQSIDTLPSLQNDGVLPFFGGHPTFDRQHQR
jgi:hypothetical protein